MHPAITKTAQKAKEAAQTPTGKKVMKIAGYTVLALIGGAIVRKIIINQRKSNTENKAGEDNDVQSAIRLRAAFNPSGFEWFINTDTTDEEVVFEVLENVSSFIKLSRAYKKLYGEGLTERLEKELQGDELQKAFEIINKK